MNKAVVNLIAAIVVLSMLASATPALLRLANAAIPLVLVVGVVVVVIRLVWHVTGRY
jgi:hypothetical protein